MDGGWGNYYEELLLFYGVNTLHFAPLIPLLLSPLLPLVLFFLDVDPGMVPVPTIGSLRFSLGLPSGRSTHPPWGSNGGCLVPALLAVAKHFPRC